MNSKKHLDVLGFNTALLMWVSIALFFSCNSSMKSKANGVMIKKLTVKESLLKSIEEQDTLLRLHYLNDTLFLSEKIMNDQVIQLQVINKNEYEKHYLSKRSIRSIGSDLFIYNCKNCHSGFPFIKEEINLSKIGTSTQLAKVLNDVRHRSQQQVNLPELSKDEVIAIYEYIKGPKQGANE